MKLLLCCVLLCCLNTAGAQPGILIGGSGSAFRFSYDGGRVDNTSVLGISAGIVYRFWVKRAISVEPSLTYIRKGAEYDGPIGISFWYPYIKRIKMDYVQLSLPLLYNWSISKDNSLSIGAGPYLAYLANAREHLDISIGTSVDGSSKIGWAKEDDFKPLDAGIRLVGGFGHKRWLCRMNYDYGITDIAPGGYETVNVHNSGLSIILLF